MRAAGRAAAAAAPAAGRWQSRCSLVTGRGRAKRLSAGVMFRKLWGRRSRHLSDGDIQPVSRPAPVRPAPPARSAGPPIRLSLVPGTSRQPAPEQTPRVDAGQARVPPERVAPETAERHHSLPWCQFVMLRGLGFEGKRLLSCGVTKSSCYGNRL